MGSSTRLIALFLLASLFVILHAANVRAAPVTEAPAEVQVTDEVSRGDASTGRLQKRQLVPGPVDFPEQTPRESETVQEIRAAPPRPPKKPAPPPLVARGVQPVRSWLTQDRWERIFPYYKASAVYTNDGKPFFTREDFLASVDWLNNHKDPSLRGFGTSSPDMEINKLEVAAFLASAIQETGDPSLAIPYPWAWPPAQNRSGPEFNTQGAGGLLCTIEGLSLSMVPLDSINDPSPLAGVMNAKVKLNDHEKYLIGFQQTAMSATVLSVANANQANFGLGVGTGGGAALDPGLVAVSDDGTLYGDAPRAENDRVKPARFAATGANKDRSKACLGTYCQYGGRGVQQLSYSFNYAPCSIDLFGDYRLSRYPNLIITQDRVRFHGIPSTFGFPGPNPGGNNRLPPYIEATTPPARQLAWITSLWFYMKALSGRSITCHQAMMQPFKYGITAANIIVNSQGGCDAASWATAKVNYFKRVGGIIGLSSSTISRSIVCPPAIN